MSIRIRLTAMACLAGLIVVIDGSAAIAQAALHKLYSSGAIRHAH